MLVHTVIADQLFLQQLFVAFGCVSQFSAIVSRFASFLPPAVSLDCYRTSELLSDLLSLPGRGCFFVSSRIVVILPLFLFSFYYSCQILMK